MNYWEQRIIDTQNAITNKSIEDTQKYILSQYKTTYKEVISKYSEVYNKVLEARAEGKEITPAWLYQLDKYWEMEAQIKTELQKMGDSEIEVLSKAFIDQYKNIYDSTELPIKNNPIFSTISNDSVQQAVNSIWCADGKNWSNRVWDNTSALAEQLNDRLVSCAVSGAKTSDFKKQLMERFNVSYSRADTLVRTEMAHLQTEAALQRYKDCGVIKFEFYTNPDERTCEQCAALDGEQFYISEKKIGVNCPPIHPNDRCCILPVIE